MWGDLFGLLNEASFSSFFPFFLRVGKVSWRPILMFYRGLWISLRSRPETAHFLQSMAFAWRLGGSAPRKKCRWGYKYRLACRIFCSMGGRRAYDYLTLKSLWVVGNRKHGILPLTPSRFGQNRLNYLPSLKAKTEVFPGDPSSVLQNRTFFENSPLPTRWPQSTFRALSGKFLEAGSTPLSITRYRSESCDSI